MGLGPTPKGVVPCTRPRVPVVPHGTQGGGGSWNRQVSRPHGPPIWGLANITNILVGFTSKFTNILEFISKFTNILVNSLVIDLFICNIVPCNNLTRLPIFFRDSFFRGITRFK